MQHFLKREAFLQNAGIVDRCFSTERYSLTGIGIKTPHELTFTQEYEYEYGAYMALELKNKTYTYKMLEIAPQTFS